MRWVGTDSNLPEGKVEPIRFVGAFWLSEPNHGGFRMPAFIGSSEICA